MNDPHLDLSALRNALDLLQAAVGVVDDSLWFRAQSPAVQNTLLAGAIQNFEAVYDLSVRMIRRQLELDADSPAEVDQSSFRDIMRLASENGLIDDVEAWFFCRRMRNISAHSYDRAKGRQVYQDTLNFAGDARSLLQRLVARNA